MWYVITGAVGLALGIGLLIWALKERSKRNKEEKNVLKLELKNTLLERQNKDLGKVVQKHKENEERLEAQIGILKKTIDGLRERLVACKDPEAITDWLDSEMNDNNV